MSRNAYAFFRFGGGVDIVRQNWGGIDAGPLHWEGCSPSHPKVAEGRMILGTPPQCVFGTFPKSKF